MKKILIIITWPVSLYACLALSFINATSSSNGFILSAISFLAMMILIILQIIYFAYKKQENRKEDILNAILPFLFFLFLLLRNYVDFGCGTTIGISGYKEHIGVLSLINMPRTTALIGLCISYAIIIAAIIFKYSFLFKRINKFRNIKILEKIVKIIMIISGLIVEAVEIISYIINSRLNGKFLVLIVFYWFVYFVINIVIKVKSTFPEKKDIDER